MDAPPIQYCKSSDGVTIAYYAIGSGPPLIALSPHVAVSIDDWKIPAARRIAEVSSRNFTYIRYDLRGCGLSDRDASDFSLQAMVHDLEAVVEATVGRRACYLVGPGNMGMAALVYSALHPAAVSRLVLWASAATGQERLPESYKQLLQLVKTDWQLASEALIRTAESLTNAELPGLYAELTRESVTPETFLRFVEAVETWDVTHVLSDVRVPTLVLHPKDHLMLPSESGKRLAAAIPGARFMLIDNPSVLLPDLRVAALIGEFFGVNAPRRERAGNSGGTAIILFADIVDSTALQEQLGNTTFRERSQTVEERVRERIAAHAGMAVEGRTLGDGVLATFSSARDAINAALACCTVGEEVGLALHLGLHAGDVMREKGNVHGQAVSIASRVSDLSAPNEVLVSATVRDLARASAGVSFEDRGEHELKGVGEPVRVFAVSGE